MKKMMKILSEGFARFEEWFNNKFGWFFTNGMKSIEDTQDS